MDQCSICPQLNRLLNVSLSWGPKATPSQPDGHHLIFIFRESAHPAPHDDTVERFRADVTQTAKYVHLSGLAQVRSYGLVGSEQVRGSMTPSFADDIETEMALTRGIKTSVEDLPTKVRRTFATTVRVKQQIAYTHLKGRRPILVSMGINAMSHNWARLHQFTLKCNLHYGPINLWISMPAKPALEEDRNDDCGICPTQVAYRLFGFFSTNAITEHEREQEVQSIGKIEASLRRPPSKLRGDGEPTDRAWRRSLDRNPWDGFGGVVLIVLR